MKKPTLRPGAAPDSDAPAKIQIATILDTADLTVGVEDVLAARVFRKALGAQATMLGLVAVGLLYLGWDAKNTRSELKKSQAALDSAVALAQARIAASEKQIVQEVDSARGLVGSADQLVKSTNDLLTATGAYHSALATNLSAIGSNLTKTEHLRGETEQLRGVVVNLDSSMRGEARQLESARMQLARQRLTDSAEIDRLSDEITSAALAFKNTYTQVVEEDAPTPVGASEFALTFDDLHDGDRLATRVTLTYQGNPIPGAWNDSHVRLNDPDEFEIDGTKYRVMLMQGTTRRVWVVNRKQRLVISIFMLQNSTLPQSVTRQPASVGPTTASTSQ